VLLDELLELQFLQHRRDWQQTAVCRQVWTREVIRITHIMHIFLKP
jgi:hypothetical protein